MKQQEVFNKIGGIIKELNEQYKYLESNPEDLNDLELELFVANAHFLADHAEILFKINAKSNVAKAVVPDIPKEENNRERYFEPVVQHVMPNVQPAGNDKTDETPTDSPVPHIDLAADTPGDAYSYIREEPETIRHELVIDEAEAADWNDNELPEEEVPAEPEIAEMSASPAKAEVVEEAIPPVKNETLFQAEEIKPVAAKNEKAAEEEVLTINQRMSAQLDKKSGTTDHLTQQSISDLKQAINLNDKLLFIKDLFNGYSLAYSEVIDILNRLNSFEEADKYLKANYAVKNNWESKPDTTGKFYALLKRRYL